MTDDSVNLDSHRGMAAQKATEARRLLAEVTENERQLRERLDALEKQLSAAPSTNWHDAAAKATYLLELFATTPQAQDPRRRQLIESVLDDFARLAKPVD
jgi:hypothetical protein